MSLPEFVVDTHALYWHLTKAPQLGTKAAAVFALAENGGATLLVPSIVFAELYYVNEKKSRPLDIALEYQRLATGQMFRCVDFFPSEVLLFDSLAAIPEMHDRIISGIAFAYGIPLLTKDQSIVNSGLIKTIW